MRLVQTVQSHLGTISGVAIHDQYMMACGAGGKTRLWKWDPDVRQYEFRRTFKGHGRSVLNVRFDKHSVITSARDGSVNVWDFRSAALLRTIQAHSKSVNGMDWDGRRIVTAGQDRLLKLWHLESGACVQTMSNSKWFLCTQLKDDMAMTGGEGKVKLWDLRSGQVVRKFSTHMSFPPAWITCLQFDDNKAVGGSFNRCAYIWDLGSARVINKWTAHEDKISSLYFEGSQLYTGSRDRHVKRWDFDSEPILPEYDYTHGSKSSNCSLM